MQSKDTSWNNVASWYDEYLEGGEDTYQRKVIFPNLTRLVAPTQGMKILDLACGQGFFSRGFAEAGAEVIGIDLSPNLIEQARKRSPGINFLVSTADAIPAVSDASMDVVTIVLAIQNIENFHGVFSECSRVLKEDGRLFLVLNHPAFRIPKKSSWGFDEKEGIQYRRLDAYISESKAEIEMHPGSNKETTVSFHRPLQAYFKALQKNGFTVERLEEWMSHKKSVGTRAILENNARNEFPLFLFLGAIRIG